MGRTMLGALVVCVALAGCSGTDPEAGPDAEQRDGLRPFGAVVVESLVGESGATITEEGVTVTVAPDTSQADLQLRIARPGDGPEHRLLGHPVEIEHEEPLAEPVVVEWDVSHLSVRERQSLVPVVWDEDRQLWIVDDVDLELDDDVVRIETDRWSIRSWAGLAQEIRELIGRGVDPPECSGDVPDWVQAFVSPDQGSDDAASLLACLEANPDDPDIVVVRVANNRPFSQFVEIEAPAVAIETIKDDPGPDPTALLHLAIGSKLDRPDRVLIPPLREASIHVARPATADRNQYVGFRTYNSPESIFIDVVGHVLAELPWEAALVDDEMIRLFIELGVECGLLELPDMTGLDIDDMVTEVVGTIKTCMEQLLNPSTELGQRFLAAVGAPSLVENPDLYSIDRLFKQLKAAEALLYVSELVGDAFIDDLVWSLNADGRPRAPGEWQANCSSPAADHRRFTNNWVTQPAFYVGETRDYHEYPEFDAIILAATSPLGACTADHVRAVRDLVRVEGVSNTETWDRIRAVLESLARSIEQTGSNAGDLTLDGCSARCGQTGSIEIVHPTWGDLTLLVFGPRPGDGPADIGGILAVDDDGVVRWRYEFGDATPVYRFQPAGAGPYYGDTDPGASGPVDGRGHVFIDYNPGRYNGVIILRPTAGGFETFETLPPASNYAGRFYYAEATDVDGDGSFEIRQYSETGPSTILEWRIDDYVERSSSPSTSTTGAPTTTATSTTSTTAPTTSTSGPATTATTAPTTSTTSTTATTAPPTTIGANVSELFARYWVAGDWAAMAGIADSSAVAEAQFWFEPGGFGAGCTDAQVDGGRCQILYAPGPSGTGLIFDATFSGQGASARVTSLTFGGDAG